MALRDLSNINVAQQQQQQQGLRADLQCAPITAISSAAAAARTNNAGAGAAAQPPQPLPVLSAAEQQQQDATLQQQSRRLEEDYAREVYEHLYERQLTTLRDATYLTRQREVEERMRVILVDWLVDVALKFKQRPETLFLAVDIVDRYLMMMQVSRGNLQLIGVTAILIAAKHEEIWAPEVRECVQITAGTYTKEDIIRVEREIAAALRYRFTLPTSFHFALRLLQMCNNSGQQAAGGVDTAAAGSNTAGGGGGALGSVANRIVSTQQQQLDNLVMFFLELSALHYRMLHWHPSTVALAAFVLGRMTQDNRRRAATSGELPVTLTPDDAFLTVYLDEASRQFCRVTDRAEIAPAVRELLRFAVTTTEPDFRFKAVHRKYSHDKYGGVARDPMLLPTEVQ